MRFGLLIVLDVMGWMCSYRWDGDVYGLSAVLQSLVKKKNEHVYSLLLMLSVVVFYLPCVKRCGSGVRLVWLTLLTLSNHCYGRIDTI